MKNTIIQNQYVGLLACALFCFSFILSSCGDDEMPPVTDPCENVNCGNGFCDGYGGCNCPPGYSGANCQNYDPCYGVNCGNGTCSNGTCQCPPGFYGNNCENVMTPLAVRITRIDLIDWPEYQSNGSVWDDNSGRPDIYLTVDINSSQVAATGYYEQCSLDTEYPYSGGELPVYVSSTGYQITVWLWDYDGSLGSENMGGVYFYPDNFQSTLTASQIIGNSNAEIQYRVYFEWIF